MRLLVDVALHDSESFASPGLSYVKWPNPVRPGDSLTVRAEVIEARRSRGQSGTHATTARWPIWSNRAISWRAAYAPSKRQAERHRRKYDTDGLRVGLWHH